MSDINACKQNYQENRTPLVFHCAAVTGFPSHRCERGARSSKCGDLSCAPAGKRDLGQGLQVSSRAELSTCPPEQSPWGPRSRLPGKLPEEVADSPPSPNAEGTQSSKMFAHQPPKESTCSRFLRKSCFTLIPYSLCVSPFPKPEKAGLL